MRYEKIKIYKFDELSDNSKEKALNYFRENNDLYFLYEYLKDMLIQELEDKKIKVFDDMDLYYSLSYCQGDGLSFVGNFEYKGINFYVRPSNNLNYSSHKYSTDIDIDNDYDDDLREEVNEVLLNEFKDLYYSICDKLEKMGYDEIEYQNSEQAIKELIEINDYEFTEDGTIF